MAEAIQKLPTDDDKRRALEQKHYVEDNQLKGEPYFGERCDNCQYYLNPDDKLSYCWHPKIRAAVGGPWWCQWWEQILDEGSESTDELKQLEPKPLDEEKAEQFQKLAAAVTLKGVPYDDQRCDNCHYYHIDPDHPIMAKLAYCWHPKLQILAGADWWCERWAKIGEPE